MRRASLGFSLVELAVVLAVTGVVGLAAWKLTLSLRPITQDPAGDALRLAEQSLAGFVLANHRLPCPATAASGGAEVCGADASGEFPYRTVGYTPAQTLHYGVYRNANALPAADADLAVVKDRYTPLLPPGSVSNNTNGLDFCLALNKAIAAPAALTAGGVPVAYALAAPGANNVFEGVQAAGAFQLPGQPRTPVNDDRVAAAGHSELSTRLGCPTRLAAVNSAARSAYAAWEWQQYGHEYDGFREYSLQLREVDAAMADASVVIASLSLANATATQVSSIAFAIQTFGLGAPAGVAAGLALTAALGLEAASVVKKISADAALATATLQRVESARYATQTAYWATSVAIPAAQNADARGLLP
jgi:hypothetical protein